MKLVSIVIPTYNQAQYLSEAIESALAQTYRPLEVIVVDDGSTDETPFLLKAYAGQVISLRQENCGLAAARNTGWRASHGEYLLFLDSDDRILPEKIARHVARLDANPDWALDYSAWQHVTQDGRNVLRESRPRREGHLLKALLLREFFFYASSAVIRQKCLRQVGGFDDVLRWNEDADLWLRLAKAGYAFGYLDDALLQYRVHMASMTANINPGQVQCWLVGLNRFFADPALADEMRELKNQAYATLHFETAGRYFRVGAPLAGRRHLEQALTLWQPSDDWLLEWAAGTALDPRTPRVDALLDAIFEYPKPAFTRLRRRARGRCHAAALFAAAARNPCSYPDKGSLRQHWLPAIWYDPSMVRNRGFWSLAWRGLVAR